MFPCLLREADEHWWLFAWQVVCVTTSGVLSTDLVAGTAGFAWTLLDCPQGTFCTNDELLGFHISAVLDCPTCRPFSHLLPRIK